VKKEGGAIQTCLARTASVDNNRSSVLSIKRTAGFDLYGVYDPATKNVWVIPIEALEDRVAIRLGKRYDDYLIPEPKSEEYRERKKRRGRFLEALRERARGIVPD